MFRVGVTDSRDRKEKKTPKLPSINVLILLPPPPPPKHCARERRERMVEVLLLPVLKPITEDQHWKPGRRVLEKLRVPGIPGAQLGLGG